MYDALGDRRAAIEQQPRFLGRVDKPEPLSDRGDLNEAEEAGREFVVSCGDAA